MPLTISFSSPGTYTIEDDGIRGNNTSVVKDAAGNVLFPFVHPADTINFVAEVPGVTLIFNATDSFGTANVTVGDLTNSSLSPDSIVVRALSTDAFATLVSNGAITEGGSDAAPDISAAGLILSAGTGVGTPGNAIETHITFIEAETTTGGINLANSGSVQVGGLTADVNGFDVVDSGDINFSTTGFILLADATGASSIHGADISGDVILTAIGADSDIFTNLDQPAIRVPGGGVTLTAGRDVILGTTGTNFNNDVLATGPIAIHAGRDFQLDGTSDVRTGAFGGVVGGGIAITVGRNIDLSNVTGGLQTIQAFQGDIVFTAGPGGTFFENAGFPGAVQTTADIILNADNVQINSGGLNTTGIGSVTIRPVTPGTAIDLGTALDGPAALGLSDNEFDVLYTLNVNIGSADSGNVTVSAPLTPFIVDNLTIETGNDILFNSTLALPRTLTLVAGDDVFFGAGAGFSSTNESLVVLVDNAQADDGMGALADLGGTITVATPVLVTGSVDADTLRGSGAVDKLIGNAGNDTLDGRAGIDRMIGGTGNDTYYADDYADAVIENAGEGIDSVFSSANHRLRDNVENLILTGGSNIYGYGNDLANALTGNSGANKLYGLGGNDTIDGGAGLDRLYGSVGNDTYLVDDYGDKAVELAGEGTDIVLSSSNYALGNNVENLTIQGTADYWAYGNAGANTLIGNSGANKLYGEAGNDVVKGGGGNDLLEGGAGQDQLYGNGGADGFVFRDGDFAGLTTSTCDQVKDFSTGDKIRLNFVDANTFLGGDQAFTFVGTAAFSHAAGELRYEQISGNTYLTGDTNGDGVADFMIRLDGLHTLGAGDLVL